MAIAVVQHDTAGPSTTSSLAFAAQNHTAGNTLVVYVAHATGGGAVTGITDTDGNTFIEDRYSAVATCGNNRLGIWHAYNIGGHATNVVTVTLNASTTNVTAGMYEISGLGTGDPIVDHTYTADAGTTIATVETLSIDGAAEAIIVAGVLQLGTFTAGSGFTAVAWSTFWANEYKVVTADQIADGTTTDGSCWGIVAASFKATAGGGGGGGRSTTFILE